MIENQIKKDMAKELEEALKEEDENSKCYVLCCLCYCINDSYKYLHDGIATEGLNFLIINPNNKALIVWHVIINILRLVSSYTYAFIAAVHLHPDMQPWLIYKLPIFFESMFGLEIVINFITALPSDNEHDHGYIYDFVRISQIYWNTTFFWDFVPLVPLHLMDMSFGR